VSRGGVDLRFIGHSTVLLELDGIRVLTDPFLRSSLGPLERHGPLPSTESLGRIDIVLISHDHPDHFDAASLRSIPGRPMGVVSRGLGAAAGLALGGEVVELAEGEQVVLGELTIKAVPAKHWMTPRGRRVRPIGYVLDAGAPVYFAGDTGRFEAMERLADPGEGALLPVWTHPLGDALPATPPSDLARSAPRTGRPVRGARRRPRADGRRPGPPTGRGYVDCCGVRRTTGMIRPAFFGYSAKCGSWATWAVHS